MNNPADFFQANVEMWQRLSEQNTKLAQQMSETMFQNWERSLAQSDALRRQMEQAVQTAVKAQFDLTNASIKALETQVHMLNDQVQRLTEQMGSQNFQR
jgi:adenylosuccinate lyase